MKGTVFLFSSVLIYKANGRTFPLFGFKKTDIVVQLKNLDKATVRDCAVSMLMHSSSESNASSKSGIWSYLFDTIQQGARPKTSPEDTEITFFLEDHESSIYFFKILNEKIDDMRGTRLNAKSVQSFKPCFMMPSNKEGKVSSIMESDEASALTKLFAQAQIMRFKPGDTILHIGAIERRLICVWKGVVACKASDGKVQSWQHLTQRC